MVGGAGEGAGAVAVGDMIQQFAMPGAMVVGWRQYGQRYFEIDFYGDDGIEADLETAIRVHMGNDPCLDIALHRQYFSLWFRRDGATQMLAMMLYRRIVRNDIEPCHPVAMIRRLIEQNMMTGDRSDFGGWRVGAIHAPVPDDGKIIGGRWKGENLQSAVICTEGIEWVTTATAVAPGVYDIMIEGIDQ